MTSFDISAPSGFVQIRGDESFTDDSVTFYDRGIPYSRRIIHSYLFASPTL